MPNSRTKAHSPPELCRRTFPQNLWTRCPMLSCADRRHSTPCSQKVALPAQYCWPTTESRWFYSPPSTSTVFEQRRLRITPPSHNSVFQVTSPWKPPLAPQTLYCYNLFMGEPGWSFEIPTDVFFGMVIAILIL